ncbi:MAG TPA: peptidoglycan recognition family protein, partial [Longimicrobium sp.]|nr:peptidoglycan recognition family protein [Longimicrobium sp.]
SIHEVSMVKKILLAAALAVFLGGCHGGAPVPDGIRYVSRGEWGAAAPVLPMTRHTLDRITIHHTATPLNAARPVEEKMRALQRFSQSEGALEDGRRKAKWADIPYHLYVAADGAVAEGRELRYVGDSNTPYDPTGHLLVVVEGNFETDTLTAAQRRTLDALIPALARRYRISADRIAAHRDFAETLCPGRTLYAEMAHFRELVAAAR